MEYLLTFLEGIITFISPCLLPMIPLYAAYFAGDAASPGRAGGGAGVRRTVVNALGFVAGFTLLFAAMGAFAGTLGGFLVANQAALNVVCGAIVIVFGLNYMGALRIPALERTLRPRASVVPRSLAGAILFGMVFALGWTPCVGAFLGSALSLAASAAQTGRGVALLLCYSLGLGVPFVIAAVLIDRLEGAFSWVKAHYAVVNRVCGALLVIVGALMATGLLGSWLAALA